ncbi:MAG: hypothetical protein JXQ90_01385 [Cyclobacteriaceae bacterium]
MKLCKYTCIIYAIFLLSCTEEFEPVYSVPERFQTHVDAFIHEANARGVELEIDNLIIKVDPTLAACGKCNSASLNDDGQKEVTLSLNEFCIQTPQQFEALIFHELGHCILGRFHDDDTLANGAPRSMMVSANTLIYSACVYDLGGGGCDLTSRRAYYLDELFNPDSPAPDWSLE